MALVIRREAGRNMIRMAVLVFLVATCGCRSGSAVRIGDSQHAPTNAGKVAVYFDADSVGRTHEVIGHVSAEKTAGWTFTNVSEQEVIAILLSKAATIGADAIVLHSLVHDRVPWGQNSLDRRCAQAIAIKYVNRIPDEEIVLTPAKTPREGLSVPEIVRQIRPSLVHIETDRGQASGAIISSSGLILTAAHVARDATAFIVELADGRRAKAVVQAIGKGRVDVALLKIDLGTVEPIPLGLVAELAVGADVVVMGSPQGLQQSVSKGLVSGIRRVDGVNLIQTDAATSPGNSGGPMVNVRGQMVGVVSFGLTGKGVEGLNFAVSIDDALDALGVSRGPK